MNLPELFESIFKTNKPDCLLMVEQMPPHENFNEGYVLSPVIIKINGRTIKIEDLRKLIKGLDLIGDPYKVNVVWSLYWNLVN